MTAQDCEIGVLLRIIGNKDLMRWKLQKKFLRLKREVLLQLEQPKYGSKGSRTATWALMIKLDLNV